MNEEAVQSLGRAQELLDRARYVYQQMRGREADTGKVIIDGLRTYRRIERQRYGVPDELSTVAVYGAPPKAAPARDLDEVAHRIVNGAGPPARVDRPVRQAPTDEGAGGRVLAQAQAMGLQISEREAALVREATALFARKNGRSCTVADLLADSLQSYLTEYEPFFGPEDTVAQALVHGLAEVPERLDLDEVARRAVHVGRCYRRGDCCRRTIGVAVSEEEIERIEGAGHRRADFLDEADMRLKAGSGGCVFYAEGLDGSPGCRVYANRPNSCRNYFCNRGPKQP